MERNTCPTTKHTRQAYRLNGNSPLVARSFSQTASMPKYKATYRGSQQGETSYIPYRSSKPPARPDVQDDDAMQQPPHHAPRRARTQGETDALPLRQHHRLFPWLRYLLAGAV